MTLFFVLAALLVAAAVLVLLAGLLRHESATTDQEAVNIKLARERLNMLKGALSEGAIDQPTYDYERQQLDYDLAADLRPEASNAPVENRKSTLLAAVLVGIFVPISAGTLYLYLGNPAAITQDRTSPTAAGTNQPNTEASVAQSSQVQQAPAMAELLPRLEERLAQSPDDVNGWRLLGRSYLSINEFTKAQKALETALALDENDTSTLAQLAESIAMSRNGNLSGEPLAYLERAIAIDDSHEHSLWLISIARQQAGNHAAAIEGFDKLASIAMRDPQALATINQMRARSQEAMGLPITAPVNENENENENEATAITVSVDISAEAKANVTEDQTVFIYARASEGPPMPLAVSRHTVGELPITITLDESMAMIPTMSLANFTEVTIGARISTSGNAIAQTGEWYSEATNVKLSNTPEIALSINARTP